MTECWGQGWAYKDNLLGSCRGCQLSKKDVLEHFKRVMSGGQKHPVEKVFSNRETGRGRDFGNEIKRMKGVSLLSSLSMSSLE